MRKILPFLLVFSNCFLNAQVFTGSGGAILNNGGQETIFNLNVSGLTQNIDSTFGLELVTINVTHPTVQELHVYLKSPSGTSVELSGVLSCSGSNFSNTQFSNSNSFTSITVGTAPYTGTFVPVGNLGRFNTNKPGNGNWQLVVKDFVGGPNAGTLVNWSLKFGSAPAKPVAFISSNLPLVFINTNNQVISETEIVVDLGIVNNGVNRNYINDPKNDYNGKAACHIRGSSSQMFEKKNLKIELRNASGTTQIDAPLLGMPTESDWVLTAGYSDKTLMRNALTHYLFQQMGHYSPRYKFVELFINGEYFGVYMLMEKIKRGNSRVDIGKLTATDNQWPYITGGYILQINRNDDPGWNSLYPGVSNTNAKFYYQYVYPKSTDITSQQANYIKSVVDSFETVMNSANFNDPVNGYKKFIEDNSFIDYFILNELSKNADAYKLSAYLYKDDIFDGGKIHIGPMWDYDIAWHNCNYGNAFSDLYWQYEQPNDDYAIPIWWTKFMQDNTFKDKLYCRYHTLRQNLLSNAQIFQFIDATTLLLNESQNRNYKQFPILGAYIYPNPQQQVGASYTTEISDLKQWVTNRSNWMDINIPGYCNDIGIEEAFANVHSFKVYPNPFNNSIFIDMQDFTSNKFRLKLCNTLGEIVYQENIIPQSELIKEVRTENLSAGIYFLTIENGEKILTKKIIKP